MLALLPIKLLACNVENARYVHTVDKGVTLEFRNVGKREGWISPLAVEVHFPATVQWFLFDRGAARYVYLISTTDVTKKDWTPTGEKAAARPLGSMTYFAWDKQSSITDRIPMPGDIAPETIFLPDLPDKMASLARPPVNVTPGFFKFSSCKQ